MAGNTITVRVTGNTAGLTKSLNTASAQVGVSMADMEKTAAVSGATAGAKFGEGFTRDANGKLRDSKGRFAKDGEALGEEVGRGFGRGFRRSGGGLRLDLRGTGQQLNGLRQTTEQIGGAMRVAALAAAVFSAAVVGGAAVGAAALLAVPAALLGLGILVAAQSTRVQTAFSGMADHVMDVMRDITKPLIGPLVRGAGQVRKAFDLIAPSLRRIFAAGAPLLDQMFAGLIPLARMLGPLLEQAFAAGVPVLRALGRGLTPLVEGLSGMFRALAGGEFSGFVTELMRGLGALLPALGRLLAAFAPIGSALLAVLVPAFIKVSDLVAKYVGPAFERLTAFFGKHADVAKGVGLALLGVVVALKAMSIVTALASAFAALTSPIALIVLAVAGIAAGLVILYQRSESFRTAVNQLWAEVQAGVAAVMPYVQQFIAAFRDALPQIIAVVRPLLTELIATIRQNLTMIVQIVRSVWAVVSAVWAKYGETIKRFTAASFRNIATVIRGALQVVRGIMKVVTSALRGDWRGVWQGIVSILRGVWNIIKGVVRQGANIVKTVLSVAWTAAKALTRAAWNGIKGAVSGAVDGFMRIVRGIKGKVSGAMSGIGGWLLEAGKDLIRGMIAGVKDMAGALADTAKNVVSDAIGGAKKVLGINSPSRVFRKIGVQSIDGLVIGLKSGRSGVKKAIGTVTTVMTKALDKRYDGKQLRAWVKYAKAVTRDERRALLRNGALQDRVTAKLTAAKQKLADIVRTQRDYAAAVKSSVVSWGSVISVGQGDGFGSLGQMFEQMRARVTAAKQWAATLKALKSAGLNSTTYDQLVQAGIEGGAGTAQALLSGGKAAIAQVNDLTKQLVTAGASAGATAASKMYDAGVQAAKGLVAGLEKEAAALDRAAVKLGKRLAKAVKQALGIRSPSTVFRDLGKQTVAGLRIGLDPGPVVSAGERLASTLLTGFGQPQLAAGLAGGAAVGGDTYEISVAVPVGASPVETGREIVRAIEAFESSGGRRRR